MTDVPRLRARAMAHRAIRGLIGVVVVSAAIVAAPASANGLNVSAFGAAWRRMGTDLEVWSNSAEASLVIDNRVQRGFLTLNAKWDNIMAGSFVSTPEGVVVGTSRDGSPISGALALQPAERQSWALRPNVTGAYRFAVVGGTRVSTPGQATYGAISRDMGAKGVGFAMHLGNAVSDGNKRQLALFREQLASFSFPTYVVPGNHEVAQGGRKEWQRLFGVMPVSFKIGTDRFIMLDNATGALEKKQEDWLVGALGRARDEKARHVFVFLHKPVVDLRPGLNQGMRDLPQARRLIKYFRQHRVHTVFAGHIPMYARERRQDVDYITSAGGGERPAVTPARGGYHHWLRVDVDEAGRVDVDPMRITAPR